MPNRTLGSAIRTLPPGIASKVAAGEVIERPASVVKELVENALDAAAVEISVAIQRGGIELIRVADNGCGIPADQVELAFQRFATSKVSTLEDLESISTLGFRGEALPSMAAVSAMTMVTRAADAESGYRIEVEDGAVREQGVEGAARGTVVAVRHLFRNLPARRRFLRSPGTEGARVRAVVTRQALAYPEVRFELTVDGALSFSSTGSGDLRDAVRAVYGGEAAAGVIEVGPASVPAGPGSPSVWGLVAPPGLSSASRARVSFVVNRRWVQSGLLMAALEQACRGFVQERRHLLAVINVALPLSEVDVNIHPAKAEVRFLREGAAFTAVEQTVRAALTAHSPVPAVRRGGPTLGRSAPSGRAPFWPVGPPAPTSPAAAGGGHGAPSPLSDSAPPTPRAALPALRPLGQVQSTYIVAEGPDGLFLIDQHAAHERVLFERLWADAVSRSIPTQTLLEPVTVELDPRQREVVASAREIIEGVGFSIEPFGEGTFLLRGVPAALTGADVAGAFVDALEAVAGNAGAETSRREAICSVACHAAVRAGKALSLQEMTELSRRLEECAQPHTCPHGRPTMIHLSASHLEREFGRR